MGQNHNLASLTRVRILLCVTLNWETGIYDPQINQSANHIQGVINAIMLNQCSRITDKTQDMSWRDTVGNVCVLGNSFSFFVPAAPCTVPHSRHHPQLSNHSKKDEGLEGESLCGTSAWLNAHRSECNGLLLLHFARDLWVWLEMSGRVLKRSNIEGEKLLLVPVLGSTTLL